jgi:hypothetical protein
VIKLYKEGPTLIWAKTEHTEEVNIAVAFGQEYFLKCGVKMGVVEARPEFRMEAAEKGRSDFDKPDAKNAASQN